MSGPSDRPAWDLPMGVNASLWQYAHTGRLAHEEDEYFESSPLFVADAEALAARFEPPGRLVDLGCGAGRHVLQCARRGFDVTGVDLAQEMLRVTRTKAARAGLPVRCVRANLCRLECFPDESFDFALSMFSTLGMIRGVEARRRALAEAARILRPGGRMALHAHNLWLNLGDPQGRRWLLGQAGKIVRGQADAGDRRMTYRGVPGMEVHLYRWRELARELDRAGFRIDEILPIDTIHARPIRFPAILPGLRAGGWLLFLSKTRPTAKISSRFMLSEQASAD